MMLAIVVELVVQYTEQFMTYFHRVLTDYAKVLAAERGASRNLEKPHPRSIIPDYVPTSLLRVSFSSNVEYKLHH